MPRIINLDQASALLEPTSTTTTVPTKGLIGLTPVTTAGFFIPGTDGDDSLYGTSDVDTMHGYRGNDFLSGAAGNDLLFGEEGNDQLYGGVGNDTLDGGAGDDLLNGGAGADTLIGGDGFDTVSYAGSAYGVYIEVATGGKTNDAQGDTYSGIEKFVGSNWGDFLWGDDNNNVFDGGAGDDWVYGNGGNDKLNGGDGWDNLNGGAGDDVLSGGLGVDTLTGGDGFDTFVFTKGAGIATVTDFNGSFDHLAFSGFGATPYGNDGKLAWGFWHHDHWDTQNLDASDQVFYDVDTGYLIAMNPGLADAMHHPGPIANALDESKIAIAEFTNDPSIPVADLLVL
jgi:Ca2+-binding RTX toxin-like protein